jgi:uncharacterized membrane protein
MVSMPEAGERPAGTGRIEAFSDGVFAIIITIMVLDLKVPAGAIEAGLVHGVLVPLAPKLASYALSFVIVALMWVNHHELLRLAQRPSRSLMWWNANLLFWMSLIPMSTAVLGEALFLQAPQVLYAIVGFACATAFTALRIHILRPYGGIRPATVRSSVLRSAAGPLLYLAAIAVTFVSPYIAPAVFCVIVAYFLFPLLQRQALSDPSAN